MGEVSEEHDDLGPSDQVITLGDDEDHWVDNPYNNKDSESLPEIVQSDDIQEDEYEYEARINIMSSLTVKMNNIMYNWHPWNIQMKYNQKKWL